MNVYLLGVTKVKPTFREARARNKYAAVIDGCYIEANRIKGDSPQINNGNYQGWYEIPNSRNAEFLAKACLHACARLGK